MHRVAEGWYFVSRLSGIEHRLLFSEIPDASSPYSADLPLDAFFELRTHAARRLWRALDGRSPGAAFRTLPVQRRRRLTASLRALDAHLDGASYRVIAEILFGPDRIRGSDWKTSEVRNQTIRLVRSGLTLMRGKYRNLLTYPFHRH
ncbi:DUF2285 domain-containing protein [Methylovirgula sp. HY1]|uniref:DUF2285 domain-containing protein n=1 Tax=Methylovirgula sp. HY1 TaxID=2822761 RepID=UPI001C5AA7B1|nr:DUF2285 domain-containing protein [Methylovirgula sp. HY1]QXX76143.1 hypothetical protein MHY1_02978 [Methylovirgula sp. HY1]